MANFNFNKVILGGRLTADPELRQTNSGLAVCSFNLAINRKGVKDEDRRADFIACTAWRERAEFLSKYFRKGSSLCVVGSLQVRDYTDKDGGKRYATEVIVDEITFVDSKGEEKEQAQSAPKSTKAAPPLYTSGGFKELEDDGDLPF